MKSFILEVDGIEVVARRTDSASIRLRVASPDGQVRVSVPKGCSIEKVREFIRSQKEWIGERQRYFERKRQLVLTGTSTGDTVMLWGQPVTLEVRENARRSSAFLENGRLVLAFKGVPDDGERMKLLDEFFRAQLVQRLPSAIEKWQQVTGVKAAQWSLRKMKTQWGSCSVNSKRIRLNLRLAMLPPECMDAVMVHELCHLHEPGHNARFRSLMDKFYPGWRSVDKILSALSGVLQ